MLREHIVPQSEVIRAIVLEDSPCGRGKPPGAQRSRSGRPRSGRPCRRSRTAAAPTPRSPDRTPYRPPVGRRPPVKSAVPAVAEAVQHRVPTSRQGELVGELRGTRAFGARDRPMGQRMHSSPPASGCVPPGHGTATAAASWPVHMRRRVSARRNPVPCKEGLIRKGDQLF